MNLFYLQSKRKALCEKAMQNGGNGVCQLSNGHSRHLDKDQEHIQQQSPVIENGVGGQSTIDGNSKSAAMKNGDLNKMNGFSSEASKLNGSYGSLKFTNSNGLHSRKTATQTQAHK